MYSTEIRKNYFQQVLEKGPSHEVKAKADVLENGEEVEKACGCFRDYMYFGTPDSEEMRQVRAKANEQYPFGSEWFVRRNCHNVEKGAYGVNPNDFFGEACRQESLKQLDNLRKGKIPFREFYNSFATKRREIADQTKTKDAEQFGSLRREGVALSYTAIKDGLGHYHEKAKQKFLSAIKDRSPLERHFLNLEEEQRVYDLDEKNQKYYIVTHLNDNQEVELDFVIVFESFFNEMKEDWYYAPINRLVFSEKGALTHIKNCDRGEWMRSFALFEKIKAEQNCESVIFHCPQSNIDLFMKKAEQVYDSILAHPEGTTTQEVLDKIAQLHWYLANIMPTSRGNAAISEMLIVTLLLYHGFYVTPYQSGIIGDMEALTTQKTQFIERFSSYRQIPFITSDVEREIIRQCGSYEAYSKLPDFPYNDSKHRNQWTDHLVIQSEDVTHKCMKGVDRLRRRFIVVKGHYETHLLFQRYTNSEAWYYSNGQDFITSNFVEMPFKHFKEIIVESA